MPLFNGLHKLNNRYLVMRHGHSLANQRGIIVSHPANGLRGYGLTRTGRDEVLVAIKGSDGLDDTTLIVSSDFQRAHATAAIVAEVLNCTSPIVLDPRLRERHFGDLELTPTDNYPAIWRHDAVDADHHQSGVESVNEVLQRTTSLIADLERAWSDATILLVAHGDVLQILLTAFVGQDARRHRLQAPLANADIRQASLPP